MEKNDLRTELNPFEMLEELLWQDQFELIFPENEKTVRTPSCLSDE